MYLAYEGKWVAFFWVIGAIGIPVVLFLTPIKVAGQKKSLGVLLVLLVLIVLTSPFALLERLLRWLRR